MAVNVTEIVHRLKPSKARSDAGVRMFDEGSVKMIRNSFARGMDKKVLARSFGCSVGTIKNIVTRQTYKDVL